MDGKGSRRLSSANDRPRRRRNVVDFRKKCKEFLVKNRQSFLAGILFTGIVILLFGVFSRFQAPSFNTPPAGTNVVVYSTLKEQVSAVNVIAVSVIECEVFALISN